MKLGLGLSLTTLCGPSGASVADLAPSITTPASVSVSETGTTVTYTFMPPVVTGTPVPAVTRVLTLDAVDVTAAMSGDVFVATRTGTPQALVMTYSASNGIAPAATSVVERTVPAVAMPLVNTVLPGITGTAQEGQTLTADTGTWTGGPTGYAWQWRRAGVDIAGASASTYALVAADVGAAITVQVTATNAGGASASATSAATTVVTAAEAEGGMVDLLAAAGSLRFPEGNRTEAASLLPALNTYKGGLYQATSGTWLPGSTTPHATYAILRLPRGQRYWPISFGVIGNSGTSGRSWRVKVGGRGSPLTGTVHERFDLYERGGTGGVAAVSSEVWDEDACLLVAGVNAAGEFYVDWYSLLDGTRHAGPRSVASTLAFNMLNNGFNVGTNGIVTEYLDNGSGGLAGTLPWPGEMEAVGVVQRDVSTAEWQAIALGADISTVLGADKLTYAREFDGTANTFGPVAGTADVTTPAVPIAGGVGIPASTLVPGSTLRRQSAAQWLMMDQVHPGHVYGLTAGQTSRAVPFSGTAGGLTGNVEVRVFHAVTGEVIKDWTSVGTISGGIWSGSLTLPKTSGWWFAEARSATNPSIIFHRRMEFGVGWKFILMGQSQMSISFGGDQALLPLGSPMSATWVGNDDSPTPSYIQVARIGMGMAHFSGSAITMRAGTNAFVNQFRVFDPDTPIMLIDEAINGTGMTQIIDSASAEGTGGTGSTTRNMNQLTRKLAVVGNDVSAVVHNWYTNDAIGFTAPASDYTDKLDALFYGTGPVAGDRNLTAELAPGWVPALSLGTRYSTDDRHGPAMIAAVDWANARSLAGIGPTINDLRIENNGGPHQTATLLTGAAMMTQRMAIAAARAVGLDTSQNPYFTTAALTDGGATITVQVVCPNGGSLYSPSPTGLRYFQVSPDGTSAARSFSGFTAAIVGNTVVLTKTTGTWSAGAAVSYSMNGPTRTTTGTTGGADEDAIIAGCLYETWAGDVVQSPPRGLPVMGTLSGGKWVPDWSVTCA